MMMNETIAILSIFLAAISIPQAGVAQALSRGHYTDLTGSRHDGYIAYQIGQDYLDYRESREAREVRLKPEDIQAFMWGVDSFAVKQGNITRVLVREGPLRLYQQDKRVEKLGNKAFDGEFRPGFAFFSRTYFLERPETGEIITVEQKKKKKFVEQMRGFLSDTPAIIQRIEAGEFIPEDILRIVQEYNKAAAGK